MTSRSLFLSLILVGGAAEAQEHPFLVVREADYPTHQARAGLSPWREMKASAIADCNSLSFDASPTAGRMRNVVSACALAFVLDPAGRTQYLNKIRDTLLQWDVLHSQRDDNPDRWVYNVPAGAAFFNSVLAIDIVHDSLTSAELSSIEGKLQTVAEWFRASGSGWPPNQQGVLGIWALYRGDGNDLAVQKANYRSALLAQFPADGVYPEGPGYAAARFGGDRDAKAHFLDVLEFTGEDTYYNEPKLGRFFEWLFGHSNSPFGKHSSFGDTSPFRDGLPRNSSAILRANRFSNLAARYAAWRSGGATFPGRLLHYLLADSALPAAEKPRSQVWPRGGAVFWEENPLAESLMGVFWSCIAGSGHAHKDVNAVYLAAYGEHVLRNSGYAGWGAGALGFPWSYINANAVSSNTVTIGGIDHQNKTGAGIAESLLGAGFDYASGESGTALPNGRHGRSLVFVHPADGAVGYFVLFDEVEADTPGASVNVALHPNADNLTVVTQEREYTSIVGPRKQTEHEVSLTVFLGTPPGSVEVRDGLLADFSNLSFVGKYLYASYPTDAQGLARLVTVLFPHDPNHPKANITRIAEGASTGAAVDLGGSVVDTAIESTGAATVAHAGVSFRGLACLYRKLNDNVAFYFVRRGRSFSDGGQPRQGFDADSEVSAYFRGGSGVIAVPLAAVVTFHYPGITGLLLDGKLQPATGSGPGWVTVQLPAGNHDLEFDLGGNRPPLASFTATPEGGEAPLSVSFDASTSSDPDGNIVSYDWGFGAGEGAGTGATPIHTYPRPGTYEVGLTVTDDAGASSQVSHPVSVSAGWVFSPVPELGDRRNYRENDPSRWTVVEDQSDLRYFLSASAFDPLPGGGLGESAVVPGHEFGNLTLWARARSAEDLQANASADYCLILGYQDAENYYYAMFNRDAQYSAIFLVKDGQRNDLSNARTNTFTDDGYHEIGFRHEGDRLEMIFEGKVLAQATDATFGAGLIGVGSYNDSVYFDDVRVEGWPGADGAEAEDGGATTDGPAQTDGGDGNRGEVQGGCGCGAGSGKDLVLFAAALILLPGLRRNKI